MHGFDLLWQWIEGLGKHTPPLVGKYPLTAATSNEAHTVSDALSVLESRHTSRVMTSEPDKRFESYLGSTDPNIAPLFERFLPPDKRRKTIGLTPDVPQLIAMSGDSKRGGELLSPTGRAGTCLACHFVNGTGRDFGPDLSKVGARLTKELLLESLLQPSKMIAQGFAAYTATLSDGSMQMGFMVKQTKDVAALKLVTGQSITLRMEEAKTIKSLPSSLMPEGLLQSLTAQEVADLLAFLVSLK